MDFPFFDFDKDFLTSEDLLFLAGASGSLIEATATGNPATFTTDVSKPLVSLVAPFTPVQAGSGDPSPDNVRAISGWTGVNIYHSGENTSNPETVPVVFPAFGANLADNANGTIYNRTISTEYERWAFSDTAKSIAVKCKPNTTYCGKTFNSNMTIFRVGTIAVDPDESTSVQNIPLLQTEDDSTTKQFTITTDADAKYIVIQGNGTIISNRTGEIMVVEGSTMPTEYEPFINTVYGGSLDLVSGVLTVTHIEISKNTADMDNTENYPGWQNTDVAQYVGSGIDRKFNIPTNVTKFYEINTKQTSGTIYFAQSSFGLAQTEWIALALDVQIIIELATPQTIQLDPVTIQTLIGNNTVWTDTNGTNTVVYLKKA